ASTSAMSSGVVTGTSRPVDASACGSMSTTSVGRPRLWAAEARPSATEVFPTPPLRLETLMTSTCSTVTDPGRDSRGQPARPGVSFARRIVRGLETHPRARGTRLHEDTGGDGLLELRDVGDDADGPSPRPQPVEHREDIAQRIRVECAESLIEEERVEVDAACRPADRVGHAEREGQRGHEPLSAGQ